MYQIKGENYDQVKGCLKETLELLKDIESITIDDKIYHIKKYFAGDLKFLALVYGINSATSDYPCLWCTCNMRNVFDINASWPISRSQKDALEKVKLKTKDQREGYIREPIISFIDFDCCLIDTLHLLLRITDKLFELLFKKLDKLDNTNSVELDSRPNLKKFLVYLEKDCALTNPYYISKSKQLKLRSLSGTERLKFLKLCFEKPDDGLVKLFPNIDFAKEIFVCKEFYELYGVIKTHDLSQFDLTELEKRLKSWLVQYMEINESDSSITPYVHAFVFHMPEFLRKFKDINQFNMQGLEKLNDLATQYYHSSTNKHKFANEYLCQLIEKRNRIEFFNLDGKLSEINESLALKEADAKVANSQADATSSVSVFNHQMLPLDQIEKKCPEIPVSGISI